jgi:hypothetical protein
LLVVARPATSVFCRLTDDWSIIHWLSRTGLLDAAVSVFLLALSSIPQAFQFIGTWALELESESSRLSRAEP